MSHFHFRNLILWLVLLTCISAFFLIIPIICKYCNLSRNFCNSSLYLLVKMVTGGGGFFHNVCILCMGPRERPPFSALNFRSRAYCFHKLPPPKKNADGVDSPDNGLGSLCINPTRKLFNEKIHTYMRTVGYRFQAVWGKYIYPFLDLSLPPICFRRFERYWTLKGP